MDAKLRAILDNLPPKPPRSKLEPFAELISELRKRQRSYREIARLLQERCGLSVGIHTLYSFVRTRGLETAEEGRQENQDPKIGRDRQATLGEFDAAVPTGDRAARQSTTVAVGSRGRRSRLHPTGDGL